MGKSSSIINDLAKTFGMKVIRRLSKCGTVSSIRGDKNCGYHSYRQGLSDTGVKIEEGTRTYGKDIYDYVRKMRNKSPGLGELITTMDGSATEQYLFASKYVTGYQRTHDWLHNVWERGVNFDDGAATKYWFDGKSLVGVLYLMHKQSAVVYQTDVKTTEVYHYDKKQG